MVKIMTLVLLILLSGSVFADYDSCKVGCKGYFGAGDSQNSCLAGCDHINHAHTDPILSAFGHCIHQCAHSNEGCEDVCLANQTAGTAYDNTGCLNGCDSYSGSIKAGCQAGCNFLDQAYKNPSLGAAEYCFYDCGSDSSCKVACQNYAW